MNIAQTMPVTLFKPLSALFCEAKMCEAPPIPPIPSPFGECISINIISKIAATVDIVHSICAIFYFSPFLIKCALFEFNSICSNVYNLAGLFEDDFVYSSSSIKPGVTSAFFLKLRLSNFFCIISS